MSRIKVFTKMFKEIIKHGDRDGCYKCKQIEKELHLKAKLEELAKA